MKITNDVTYHLNNISRVGILEKISEFENINISKKNLGKIKYISENIKDIKDEVDDYEKIVDLLSLFNYENLSSFLLDIERVDSVFLSQLIDTINQMNNVNNENAKKITDKLLSVYSMSLIKTVFSEERIRKLENILTNN